MRNLLALALFALVVYTIVDVVRADDVERKRLHPAVWVAFMLLLPVLGSVVWLVVRRRGAPPSARVPGISSVPRAPLAPDDDPEFLWRLDEERRRAQGPAEGDDAPPSGPGASQT